MQEVIMQNSLRSCMLQFKVWFKVSCLYHILSSRCSFAKNQGGNQWYKPKISTYFICFPHYVCCYAAEWSAHCLLWFMRAKQQRLYTELIKKTLTGSYQNSPHVYLLWVRLVSSVHRPRLQVHRHPPVGLPVDGHRRDPRRLRPRGYGGFDVGAVDVVARATPVVGDERRRQRRGGDDVDGGLRGGVVVDGERGGDGGGVVIAQLLS